MARGICTHCGEHKKVTRDHVVPTCLFVGPSNERSIKVPSCEDCNCKSEEGLLKSLFSLFDERISPTRLQELTHPQGRGDLRSFLGICTPDLRVAYMEERVTGLLKKLFQGFRRHLLKDDWTFVGADDLTVFSRTTLSNRSVIRPLPLRVGGPNEGYLLPPDFEGEDYLVHTFRDFRFGMVEPDFIALKYGRTSHGNELSLLGLFRSVES